LFGATTGGRPAGKIIGGVGVGGVGLLVLVCAWGDGWCCDGECVQRPRSWLHPLNFLVRR